MVSHCALILFTAPVRGGQEEELVRLGDGCVSRSLVTGRLIMQQHGQERQAGLELKHKQTNKQTNQMLLTPRGCLCSAVFLSTELFYKQKGLCKNSLDEPQKP